MRIHPAMPCHAMPCIYCTVLYLYLYVSIHLDLPLAQEGDGGEDRAGMTGARICFLPRLQIVERLSGAGVLPLRPVLGWAGPGCFCWAARLGLAAVRCCTLMFTFMLMLMLMEQELYFRA